MQLGELQSQIDRFSARGGSVIALSVDPPAHSTAMVRRLGLSFVIASDQNQAVQKAFRVQNPDTNELALHAVYIIDETRRIFYRKVAGRRPLSQELLDAIDFEFGRYPMNDEAGKYAGTPVAFPRNNFQALLNVSLVDSLPESLDEKRLREVVDLIANRRLDDATIAYRRYMSEVAERVGKNDLLDGAAWLATQAVSLPDDARLAGKALNQALVEQRSLPADISDEAKAATDRHLETVRSMIRSNANVWRLASLKTTLRGYRELSLAAVRSVDAE